MHLSRVTQRALCFKKTYNSFCYSTTSQTTSVTPTPPKHNLEQLKARSLIQLKGSDAAGLLQGLITNDIYQMPQDNCKHNSLYAMFLNSKGRIICDSIIYCVGDNETYIVEADVQIIEQLMKHLKMYKLRKQVEIGLMDSYKVYALYDPSIAKFKDNKGLVPQVLECLKEPMKNSSNGMKLKNIHLFCDPRVPLLGYRILARKMDVVYDELCVENIDPPLTMNNFRWLRYNLGVCEGIVDIPPQVCFPLEHNCDYMNGLNLHKGCYLGQELTARTYHTGKIRKRIMPLYLKQQLYQTPSDLSLKDDKGNSVGKLRGVQFDAALALLRMHLVVDTEISVGGTRAITQIPNWWPGFKTKLQDEIANKNVL